MLGKSLVAPPAPCQDICDNGTDAVVYGQKMQPILAVMSGVVTAVEESDPVAGSVSVTITDALGRTYHYSGFNDDTPGTADGAAIRPYRLTVLAQVGTQVRAGQVIGFMGDTDPMPSNESFGIGDEAVWPHLRLSIYDQDGTKLNADSLVAIAQRRQACHVVIGPWSLPPDRSLQRPGSRRRRDGADPQRQLDGARRRHADRHRQVGPDRPAGRLHVVTVGDVRVRRQGRHPEARLGRADRRFRPSSGSRRSRRRSRPSRRFSDPSYDVKRLVRLRRG